MYHQMTFRNVLLSIFLLLPMTAYAHLISITPSVPFPATVVTSSSVQATFVVTNIASKVNVTAVDQSHFSESSGLSITSTTCGSVLAPGQSCTIQVELQAGPVPRVVASELKEWAKPTADGVQYPIRVTVTSNLPNITLTALDSTGLPAVREPVVAQSGGNWLIASGSTGDFHDFNTNFITSLYVYNPMTMQVYSASMDSLPATVKAQLLSSDPEFYQDGDTLYIIGGFYTPDNTHWTTLNTVTAINVPNMINAIINHVSDLSPFVTYNTGIPAFKVTGGQLSKIGNYFYLVYGQDCEGNYCATSQTYTNTIYKFTMDASLNSITIVDSVAHGDHDNSGWRRRDYTLSPFMMGNQQTLFAMGGPFTPGSDAMVWMNGIMINEDLTTNDHFITQQANQYSSSFLPMYSANATKMYVATFSGLSNTYWSTSGLVFDNTTPYGNILDLISYDASGNVREYANIHPLCSGQPLASCLYMGLVANFIPVPNYFDSRGILQLDQLPQDTPTLVGYVYGGLTSTGQEVFGTDPSYASNQVYGIYVTPSGSKTLAWKDITNYFATG